MREIPADLAERLEAFYRDLHTNPELSFQEHRTAERVVTALGGVDAEVTAGVGGTGVVAVLRNGDGPTVLLRADFDALPVAERTGLPYASAARGTDEDGNDVPVMHACGHDMHATCLLGTLELLDGARPEWSGTVLAVFQPAEELARGATAMLDDGLFERFGTPDIVLGQHVGPLPAGMIGYRGGPVMSSSDSARVTLYGRGGHGSRPESTVDPVLLAASIVVRLQGVVAREVGAGETAVLTVGKMQAGTKDNVIPETAELGINTRAYSEQVRAHIRAAVERIVTGEAAVSGAPREPRIEWHTSAPVLECDPEATELIGAALTGEFGEHAMLSLPMVTASEDVGNFARAAGVPAVYWFWGGLDADTVLTAMREGRMERDIPSNHSAEFAPVIEPTLSTGVRALTTAALRGLGKPG